LSVQPNYILGAAGLLIAIATGSFIGTHWETLSDLHHYEARFQASTSVLAERAAGLAAGGQANETYTVAHANVTHLRVDLSWSEPVLQSPEIGLRVIDPQGVVRADERHTGGVSGIHFNLTLIPDDQVPRDVHPFNARPTDLRKTFDARWPTHPQSRGLWRFEITNPPAPNAAASTAVTYDIRVAYDSYAGTYREVQVAPR